MPGESGTAVAPHAAYLGSAVAKALANAASGAAREGAAARRALSRLLLRIVLRALPLTLDRRDLRTESVDLSPRALELVLELDDPPLLLH